jgi:EpsI family protein
MTDTLRHRKWWWAPGAWLLLAACVAATFSRTFVEMWARWFPAWRDGGSLYERIVGGESYYTHGPLVPLVSLAAALLLMRHTRIRVKPAPLAGWATLAGGIVLHLLACLARVSFVSGFALLAVTAGLILLVWGAEALRRLWFPVAFLAFLVPLPDVTLSQWNFYLRTQSARIGVLLADFLGVAVERNGNQVFLSGGKSLVIANVCNGLRTMISLLAFGALYAYVCRLRGAWRVGLFALALPVAVVANSVRIVSLILVADHWDVPTAVGWYHDFSGIMIFVVAFLLMFGIERFVLWARKAAGRPATVLPLFHDVRRGPDDDAQGAVLARSPASARGLAAACALGLATAGTWWLNQSVPPMWTGNLVKRAVPPALVIEGNTWLGRDFTMDETTLQVLETRDYLYRRYDSDAGGSVYLSVIFSADNRKGTHPPELCLRGSGEGIVASADLSVANVPGRGVVPCRELVAQAGAGRDYFLYTYKCGREYAGSFWRQQMVILLNGLLHRNAGGALIRVSARVEGSDVSRARRQCAALLREAIPHLDQSLP